MVKENIEERFEKKLEEVGKKFEEDRLRKIAVRELDRKIAEKRVKNLFKENETQKN